MPSWDLLRETVCMVMTCGLHDLRAHDLQAPWLAIPAPCGASSSHAALDRQSHQLGRCANPELLAHDRGCIGDCFVGGVDQPCDLGEIFADAEQTQYFHLA